MRKIVMVSLAIILTACATPTTVAPPTSAATASAALTSDVTPPTGRLPNAPPESPGEFRLLGATSPDGLTFTRNNLVISDQANVPDMILDAQGRILLYYNTSKVGNIQDATVVAISSDNGKTWVYKLAKFTGINRAALSDPDIVRMPDGTIRFYGTTQVGKNIGIVVAESKDGITFNVLGTAFEVSGEDARDSVTYQVGGQWHMMSLANFTTDMWYATSSDGLKFTKQDRVKFTINNENYVPSNGIPVDNGLRMYVFSNPVKQIRSYFTTDGKTWKLEDGVRLAFDPANPLEYDYIKDVSVVKLNNGSYFMAYTTKLK